MENGRNEVDDRPLSADDLIGSDLLDGLVETQTIESIITFVVAGEEELLGSLVVKDDRRSKVSAQRVGVLENITRFQVQRA